MDRSQSIKRMIENIGIHCAREIFVRRLEIANPCKFKAVLKKDFQPVDETNTQVLIWDDYLVTIRRG